MKFRKGDVVVVTGNGRSKELFRTWPKLYWEEIIGKNGVVSKVWKDGHIEIIHDDCSKDIVSIFIFIYHQSELTKAGHIHKRDWPGLGLRGF